ncbi:putative BRCA1-associated 2 [Helianthus anomalus]
MTLWNVATRTTIVFIVVVPNYLSVEEFVAFCGRHVDEFTDLCFVRNDVVEDRYSVLIKLANHFKHLKKSIKFKNHKEA